MSDLAKVIMFAICMYCGFEYDSAWAFVGAVIMFLAILD